MANEYGTRLRVALLTNIVHPYRIPLYQNLNKRVDLMLLLSGTEANRQWDQQHVPGVRARPVAGFTISWKQVSRYGHVVEERYTHINPGYLTALLRHHPQAIISTEMGFRSLVALLYGFVFRVPVWIWWEGGVHASHQFGNTLFQRLLRRHFFARVARRWIAWGDVSSEYLQVLGVDRGSILQAQQAVDPHLFSPDGERFPLNSSHPRLLCVSRLVELKGIEELLDAVATVQAEGQKFSLVLVGDGPERETVATTIERLGIHGVEWLRWVAPEDMPSVYRACDVMIFPTLVDVWGLVVNEALLCGLPVLSSIYAGCARELLPEENLFDPLAPDDLANAIRRAIRGGVAPPDLSRLQPLEDVIDRITTAVMHEVKSPG